MLWSFGIAFFTVEMMQGQVSFFLPDLEREIHMNGCSDLVRTDVDRSSQIAAPV